MILSTLSRLVRKANPYVASLLDDKDFGKPGEYAREADNKLATFKEMAIPPQVSVRRIEEETPEEEQEYEAVAWAQRQPAPPKRPQGPHKEYPRYPYHTNQDQAPPPRRWDQRCYACEEPGHFARECPYVAEARDQARKRKEDLTPNSRR